MSRMLKSDLLNINREYESGNDPRSWINNLSGWEKNRLGCLFNCEDYFHFHIFIRNSKYESFHWIISIHVNLVGNLRKGVFERLTSTLSESYLAATKLSLLLQRRFAQKFGWKQWPIMQKNPLPQSSLFKIPNFSN